MSALFPGPFQLLLSSFPYATVIWLCLGSILHQESAKKTPVSPRPLNPARHPKVPARPRSRGPLLASCAEPAISATYESKYLHVHTVPGPLLAAPLSPRSSCAGNPPCPVQPKSLHLFHLFSLLLLFAIFSLSRSSADRLLLVNPPVLALPAIYSCFPSRLCLKILIVCLAFLLCCLCGSRFFDVWYLPPTAH